MPSGDYCISTERTQQHQWPDAWIASSLVYSAYGTVVFQSENMPAGLDRHAQACNE